MTANITGTKNKSLLVHGGPDFAGHDVDEGLMRVNVQRRCAARRKLDLQQGHFVAFDHWLDPQLPARRLTFDRLDDQRRNVGIFRQDHRGPGLACFHSESPLIRPAVHPPNSSPNSRARRLAARTAATIASVTWLASRLASAAAVVPPLDVTRSRSVATGSLAVDANCAAPAKVWTASARACASLNPNSRPARISASMK